ncbi:MAG TPA: glycosyltransferase family 4 protein [Hanamia sp.]
MRILHLIYTSGIYGAEKHLLDLLPELKKYDIHCDLLFICPKRSIASLQEYCNQMNGKGVKTTLLPTTSKISVLLTARKIFRYLKLNNIRIIHSHLFSADIIAVLIKEIYFKKLIVLSTKHGYEEKYLVQYGLGNKKPRYNFYYFITRAIIKRTDYNLAVSSSLSEMYYSLKLSKNKMKYVHHGISPKPSSEIQAQINGNSNLMIVGRLAQIKGHTYLFQALPEIIKRLPELKLFVLGDGPLKENLIKQAKSLNILSHIKFVGFAKPQTYSSQCQLMIAPSLYESFGLVYIESFALKIPVVAFDAETANQIIENNKTGILVDKLNVDVLAEKIIYLLENPDERKRIVDNAYSKYLEYYTLERMAKETAEWYKRVPGISEK